MFSWLANKHFPSDVRKST